MSLHAFHLTGFGRLVVCESHATDVWMWLWMESEVGGQPTMARGNDRCCAVCTPDGRRPQGLEQALARQGRPPSRAVPLKRAA